MKSAPRTGIRLDSPLYEPPRRRNSSEPTVVVPVPTRRPAQWLPSVFLDSKTART